MISNIVQPRKLRNFHIFDNTDALNIHLSLKETNSDRCQGINLPGSNTSGEEIVCESNIINPSTPGNCVFPTHFKRNPVGIFNGSWVNIHKNKQP